jgi:hypothetical protein
MIGKRQPTMTEQLRDIDEIILKVKRELPLSGVYQLEVKNPHDDDGLWYFYLPGIERDIQIESSYGMCPFIVETNEQSAYDARKANTVDEAVSMIVEYLNSISDSSP